MLDLSGALRGAGETPPRQLAVCRRNQQVEGIEIEFNYKLSEHIDEIGSSAPLALSS